MEPQKNTKNYCCRFLLGTCKFAEKCRYLHEALPNNLCKFYTLTGNCTHGKKCDFLHDNKKIGPCKEDFFTITINEEIKNLSKTQISNGIHLPEKFVQNEEVKIIKIGAPATRTPFVKQGQRPDEKEIFEKNKLTWSKFSSYQDYIKSLKTEEEKDLAQILRRFQYSYEKISNPDGNSETILLKLT